MWLLFTQEEKDIWLSFSVDTRQRILSCCANNNSTQQSEEPASSLPSAMCTLNQRPQPRHQSRRRTYNQRPINQQTSVRLAEQYDIAGEPDEEINQRTSVSLAEQYDIAGGT